MSLRPFFADLQVATIFIYINLVYLPLKILFRSDILDNRHDADDYFEYDSGGHHF